MAIFTKCNICEKPNQEIIGSGMFHSKEFKICILCFEKHMAMIDLFTRPYQNLPGDKPVYYSLPGKGQHEGEIIK